MASLRFILIALAACAAGCFENGGAPCGGELDIACPEGQFCTFVGGGCGGGGQLGLCRVRPDACPLLFAPVCGCDGVTYDNECLARAAGVNVDFAGECDTQGDFCGGIAGIPCNEGEYCRFVAGTCGAADQPGTCTPLPTVCPDVLAPVCGCDDRTYPNDCEAAAEGISVQSSGECD